MTTRSSTLMLLPTFVAALAGCPPKQAPVESTPTPPPATAKPAPAPITEQEVETLKQNFQRVLFDFDKASITDSGRQLLSANAKILTAHPNVVVRIEGHTDHFGSDEYNLALGQRRAETVSQYLSSLGVSANQLKVISFGREKTIVPPSSVEDEAVNRRAEFVVLAGQDAAGSSDSAPVRVNVDVE